MAEDYQDYLAWTYFGPEALDSVEFDRLASLLRGVDHFIDVGASHGVYTYHANRLLSNAEIVAIEADPDRFEVLEKNVAQWGADSSNRIRCVLAAASDEQERQAGSTITFFTTGTQISGGLFAVPERSDDYQATSVPLVCVDDFFVPNTNTVIKIDVEGSELRVLKGSQQHISSGSTRFFTEISWWGDRGRGTSSLDVLRFCMASGLRVDRRLRSDYLLSPESSAAIRLASTIRCLPPLLGRYAWNRFVPRFVRTMRERRQNAKRLKRFADSYRPDS